MGDPVSAYFVCGGKWHDMDFARVEVLKLLDEDPEIRTRVGEDFRDVESIAEADFLITYTCDLRVSDAQQDALASFVERGGRWFALHGTNSVFEFVEDEVVSPRVQSKFMKTLGSQFIAHPPVGTFAVRNCRPDHPLVKGIDTFEVEDEIYLCEYHGEIEPLLETRFTGEATGFRDLNWPKDDPRLVFYLHPAGRGEVLYLTLGHCRGVYDMRPMMDRYPQVERCAWESPVFYELLRRGIRWAKSGLDGVA